MRTTLSFTERLADYLQQFTEAVRRYDGTTCRSAELESAIDAYAAFVTDEANLTAWRVMEREAPDTLDRLASDLRAASARCVSLMEKYRARKLLDGSAERTDYFRNIEACIDREFGRFRVTDASRVVLVGSGAFPMTPLLIAKRTGAQVTGVDIDEEAVELGRKVAAVLGEGLPIRLEHISVERHAGIEDATHIIFSSTVSVKYELLDRLHPLTGEGVVVAMRYGDGLKSLFNYPSRETDPGRWLLADAVHQPDQVFDIALYRKVGADE